MKTGLTIEELATEIMRQRDVKTDYIVDTTKLCMENYDTSLVLRVLGDNGMDIIEPLDIADTAHRQIGARLGIPAKYYGKMLSEHPELLARNKQVLNCTSVLCDRITELSVPKKL